MAKLLFYLFCLPVFLIGCQRLLPVVVRTPAPTAVSPLSVLPTALPATAVPPTVAAATPTFAPAADLFAIPWDDRTPFRAGLLPGEQTVLDQLPGASVYHLALTIADSLTEVNGRLQLHYTNQEDVPLPQLYFHLFPNLLDGAISISQIMVNGRFQEPILEGPQNSLLHIPLAEPLQPGQQLVVQMAFITTVPRNSERNYGIFAYREDVLALAHFYPLTAVYDDEGWNITPPDVGGDVTYSDTSFYLVQVTAPSNQVIAASGVVLNRTTTGTSQTLMLAAGPMRDFYLASSARYSVVSQRSGQIQINSYAPAELADAAAAALDAAVFAVERFNGRFGPYPYTELDLVATPTLALGVEYPGIIANALRIYPAGQGSGFSNQTLLESTTVHEVGHQWFYSLIGNDQLDEPWLDESLTQYAAWLYYRDRYGEPGDAGFAEALTGRWAQVGSADIPIGQPVSRYTAQEYGAIIYGRGPLFVDALAQVLGEETFAAFLQDYYRTYRWGIATTASFQELAEHHCQCDLTPLFAAWVYGR